MLKHLGEGLPLACEPIAQRYPAGTWLRLSLLDGSTCWPRGWTLFRLQLHCHGERGYTYLRLVERSGAERMLTLPVSRRGRLLELVHLHVDVDEVWLQPMSGNGWCTLEDLSVRPQQGLEPVTRRLLRVVPMLWRQPRSLRHRVGLRSHLVLRDLTAAYSSAGELRDYVPDTDYRRWAFLHNHLGADDRRTIAAQIARWRQLPNFWVEIAPCDGGDVSETLDSLSAQLYQAFTLASANSSLASDPMRWVLCLPAGVRLAEHALYWLAHELLSQPDVRAVYVDHDHGLEDLKQYGPCFKPDCSPALLACTHYMGPVVVLRADVLAAAPERNVYVALLMLAQQQPKSVRHVPAVLCHLPKTLNWRQPESERAALQFVFPNSRVEEGLRGHWRLRHPLPSELPRVSVVIPTRDNLAVLQACVESVLARSSYPNLEILVVDNQSADPAALAYLNALQDRLSVRVLRYADVFNFSAINNWAVAQATGEFVCLLNNDTEVITPGWVEEMLSQLLQPGVGVVGAKLYYSDGRVQHAGDAVGPGGCADHFFNRKAHDDPGYMDRCMLVQDMSAVTAACLLTYRDLYLNLGGLNAVNLPVAFNDVDYCLRVRELGRRVVWTPYAELYHHESVSRGKDESPEKRARAARELLYMRRRWKKVLRNDPFYNPNLSYDRPDFSLARQPRVIPPWRSSNWKIWRRGA